MSQMPSDAGNRPPSDEITDQFLKTYMETSGLNQEEALAELRQKIDDRGPIPNARDLINPQINAEMPTQTTNAPTMGAPSSSEQARIDRQIAEEEFERDTPADILNETAIGRGIAQSVTNFALFYGDRDTPWLQGVADAPGGNVPAGLGRGVYNAGVNGISTMLSMAGWSQDKLPNVSDNPIDYGDYAWTGQLAEGVSQFVSGFAVGTAGGHQMGITKSFIALSAFGGAIADASVWDPREGNVATMIRQFFPESAYDAYLEAFDSKAAYEETGSALYARFLSAVEGAAIGEIAAPMLLGPVLQSMRGMAKGARAVKRGIDDIGEGFAEGSRMNVLEREGYLDRAFRGDIPMDILDRPASRELTREINKQVARFMARNARATAIATANPNMSVADIVRQIDAEGLSAVEGAGEGVRFAAAQALYETIQGTPLAKQVKLEDLEALMQFGDPNRTFFVTDNLPKSTDEILFQEAKNDDRSGFLSARRNERDTGPGNLSQPMKDEIAVLQERHNLTPADVKFIKEKLNKTLKDFPLAQWQKIEIAQIFSPEKDAKGNVIPGTSVLKRDGDGMPKLNAKFKSLNYSFANENPRRVDSPVINRSKNPQKWNGRVNSLSRTIEKEVLEVLERSKKGDVDAESIINARDWYASMRGSLVRNFGGQARLFAEMLGATSPQTAVGQNFRYTVDIMQNYSRGTYDDLLNRYIEFRDAGGTYQQWEKGKNAIIFQDGKVGPANGVAPLFRKYGSNTPLVMDTLAGHWLGSRYSRPMLDPQKISDYAERGLIKAKDLGVDGDGFPQAIEDLKTAWMRRDEGQSLSKAEKSLLGAMENLEARANQEAVAGRAPKAFNFASNLMGTTRAATIDVWAARGLTRMAGGSPLPPPAEQAVAGLFMSTDDVVKFGGDIRDPEGATTSGFGMGQQAFAKAAQNLSQHPSGLFADMQPDDLQALVWFLEKERWAKRGWTSETGGGGSFDFESDKYFGDDETVRNMNVFELDMASDEIGDKAGRVMIGASTVTDQAPTLAGATRSFDEYGRPVVEGGVEIQRSSPMSDSAAMGLTNTILADDPTVLAYSMSRNQGIFLATGEDSIAIEMTLGRSFGNETRFRPTDEAEAARLSSGELERVDIGKRRDVIRDAETGEVLPRSRQVDRLDDDGNVVKDKETGKPLKDKKVLQAARQEYPLLKEPDMASALHVAARIQQDFGQQAVLVSRILDQEAVDASGGLRGLTAEEVLEANPNARPGMEITFDRPRSPEDMEEVMEYLRQNYLGAQLMVDSGVAGVDRAARTSGRATPSAFVGVRVLDVPEFYTDAATVREAGGSEFMKERFDSFDEFMNEISGFETVSRIDRITVDTMVVGDEAGYIPAKEILDAEGNIRTNAGEVWSGRPWYEERPATAAGAGEEVAGPGGRAGVKGPEGGDPAVGEVTDTSPDVELYQAARGPSTNLDPRGAAVVDREEGIALIKFFRSADRTTAVHEMGHAIRVTQMGTRAKNGQGALSLEQITAVERAYGVKNGKWTRAQEERFAEEFESYMAAGGPRSSIDLPAPLREAFDFAGAAMRDVYKDAKAGTVPITKEVQAVLDTLVNNRGLPVRYAPNRYVRVADFKSVIQKIGEAEKEGVDIMDVVTPEDILGTGRLDKGGNPRLAQRFDVSTPDDALKLIAHFNAFTRELLESDVLIRPKSRDRMVSNALESLNGLLGRDPDMMDQTMSDLLGSVDMRKTGDGGLDDRLMAANMMLVFKAKGLVDLAKKAGETGSPVDIAAMHRAALEYQVVQSAVAAAGTNWGRAGHAMQNVKLPSPEELGDPKVAEEFLVGLGMRPGTLVSDSEEIINGLALVEVPRDNFAIGKMLRHEAENRGATKRALDMAKELFVNNLLSGPKTWFTLSVFSPMLNMTMDSMMKFAGGAVMRGMGDSRGMTQMRRESENLREMILQAGVSFEYMLRAFKNERGVLMPGTQLYDDPRANVAIRSESDNAVARHLINATGKVVRMPSRMIMTFDEFFRQLNGRTHLISRLMAQTEDQFIKAAKLNDTLPEEPTPIQMEAFFASNKNRMRETVMSRVEETIRDGRIRDQNTIVEEAMAKPEISAIDDDLERAMAIREYYNDQYTESHKRNVAYTRDYATRAVFQGELEGVGAAIQRGIDNNLGGVLRFVVPFFRTPWKIQEKFFSLSPTNVLAEVMSRSARGMSGKGFTLPETANLSVFHRKHLEDLASNNPRRIAEARGRQAAGIAITSTVFGLAEEGRITGGGPIDHEERKIWQNAGWRPYSFQSSDGTYVSFVGWDPLAQYLALAADTHQLMNAEDGFYTNEEQIGLMQAIIMTMGRQIQEKPYIQGISQLIDLFDRDDFRSVERFGANLALGFVPYSAMQQQFSQATDPVLREHRSILDFLNARTFLGNNENVAPRYNVLGETVKPATESTAPIWNWINRVNVSKVSQETTDPVMLELYRSGAVPEKIGPMHAKQDLREIPASDGVHSVYDEWQRNVAKVTHPQTGQTLRETLAELIESEDYQKYKGASPDPVTDKTPRQVKIVEIVNMYKGLAWTATMLSNPELEARMNQVTVDRLRVQDGNQRDAHGEDSGQARTTGRALNKALESMSGDRNPEKFQKILEKLGVEP